MTVMKERAMNMIRRMPDEKVYYVVQLLESVEGLSESIVEGLETPEQMALKDLRRFCKRIDVEIDYKAELAKGVKHFKEEGGRKAMCEAVEKYAEQYADRKAAEKVKEERNIMTQ